MNFLSNPTFVIKTLGCKVNQYESQVMRERLAERGFVGNNEDAAADFYIINSCTVTRNADRETRNLIRRYHRVNPDAKIIIAGCCAELEEDRRLLANMGLVWLQLRNSEKLDIADILQSSPNNNVHTEKQLIGQFRDRDRAFVKVQDGCDHQCSYCKIPFVRGVSKSRNVGEIREEIDRLAENGFKEIVLTGICLGAWGLDLEHKMTLANLIESVISIQGSFRVRLSSIEPIYITDALVDLIGNNERLCKHVHIPLQSGDNAILKKMRRPYDKGKFCGIVKKIRRKIPDIGLTTDVLVGFPGETDANFARTVAFVKKIKPSRVHVFSYSRREVTAAARYKNHVDAKVIRQRVKFLMHVTHELALSFAKDFVGEIQHVLIESCRDKNTGLLSGYTDRYVRVFIEGPDRFKGMLVPVRITGVHEEKNAAFGRLDNELII